MEPDVRGGTWAAEQGTEAGPEGCGTGVGSLQIQPLFCAVWPGSTPRGGRFTPGPRGRDAAAHRDTGEQGRAAHWDADRVHGARRVGRRDPLPRTGPGARRAAARTRAHLRALAGRPLPRRERTGTTGGGLRTPSTSALRRAVHHPPARGAGPASILAMRAIGGALSAGPARAALGGRPATSIAPGWWSTRRAPASPAVAGRALGLDTVNLGYAGGGPRQTAHRRTARTPSGRCHHARLRHQLLVAYAFAATLLYETTLAFVRLIHLGHPDVPVLLLFPVLRPEAEASANQTGQHPGRAAHRDGGGGPGPDRMR